MPRQNNSPQTIQVAIEELETAGWRYMHDTTTWTGGFWWHDDIGGATNQGGHWPNICEATASAFRSIEALRQADGEL